MKKKKMNKRNLIFGLENPNHHKNCPKNAEMPTLKERNTSICMKTLLFSTTTRIQMI